jgi:hypothetical protein
VNGDAAPGDDERRHHRLGMARFQPMEDAEQNGARHEEPGVGGPLLEQIGE